MKTALQRLGVDSLDVAFVHDISPDFPYFPTSWEEQFAIAERGAFPALSKMREEGIVKAWGIGVNRPEPILRVIDVADPDVCLCASQYSLIDHANAVNQLFPAVRKKNVSLVIGSALNAGFLSGSPRSATTARTITRFPPAHIEKREKLRTLAARYGVDLRHRRVAVFIRAGCCGGDGSRCQHASANLARSPTLMHAKIPAEFWQQLRSNGLIEKDATVPVGT